MRRRIALGGMMAFYLAACLTDDPRPLYDPLTPPSLAPPFGADLLGRDVLRVALIALRHTLNDVLLALGTAFLLALATALLTAVAWEPGRHLVRAGMATLTAAPPLLSALLAARLLDGGLLATAGALTLVAWPRIFKLLDAEIQALRVQPYWRMTWVLGLRGTTRFAHYLLPAGADLAGRLLPLEAMELVALHATLSFLGASAQDPYHALGRLVAGGRQFLELAPWLFWTPVFLLAVVLALLWAATPNVKESRTL